MSVRLNTDNRPAQQHPLDSRGMERLPEDVLTQVLGGLNQHDIQASVLVSRAMKERVITTVNTNELDSIKNFIKSLIQGLPADVFPRQRAAFAAILEQVSSRAFVNLSPLKRYALEAKQQLIDVLKTIDPEAVPRIGKVPQFMENIFPLAAVYREIDHAVNTSRHQEELEAPCLRAFRTLLIDLGEVDRAFAVAQRIYRSEYCQEIYRIFLGRGHIDMAVEIASRLHVESKELALKRIADTCIRLGQMDKAMQIAGMIDPGKNRWEAFRNIATAFVKLGNIDRAIEIARTMADEPGTFDALSDACIELGQMGQAMQMAQKIAPGDTRWWAFQKIATALAKLGHIDRAVEIVKTIPEEEWAYRKRAFWNISAALTEQQNIRGAIKIIQMIPTSWGQESSLREIAKEAIKFGDIDGSLAAARAISSQQLRRSVLEDISEAFIERGDMDKVLEIAEYLK